LQEKWQFVQRVTKGICPAFASIKQGLAETFLPNIFGNKYDVEDPCPLLIFLLSGQDWQSQTPQGWRSQTMRQAFLLIF
jgi:hypothetical protein